MGPASQGMVDRVKGGADSVKLMAFNSVEDMLKESSQQRFFPARIIVASKYIGNDPEGTIDSLYGYWQSYSADILMVCLASEQAGNDRLFMSRFKAGNCSPVVIQQLGEPIMLDMILSTVPSLRAKHYTSSDLKVPSMQSSYAAAAAPVAQKMVQPDPVEAPKKKGFLGGIFGGKSKDAQPKKPQEQAQRPAPKGNVVPNAPAAVGQGVQVLGDAAAGINGYAASEAGAAAAGLAGTMGAGGVIDRNFVDKAHAKAHISEGFQPQQAEEYKFAAGESMPLDMLDLGSMGENHSETGLLDDDELDQPFVVPAQEEAQYTGMEQQNYTQSIPVQEQDVEEYVDSPVSAFDTVLAGNELEEEGDGNYWGNAGQDDGNGWGSQEPNLPQENGYDPEENFNGGVFGNPVAGIDQFDNGNGFNENTQGVYQEPYQEQYTDQVDETYAPVAGGYYVVPTQRQIIIVTGDSGVGVTTQCAMMAMEFKEEGFRPLIVDLDDQRHGALANLTNSQLRETRWGSNISRADAVDMDGLHILSNGYSNGTSDEDYETLLGHDPKIFSAFNRVIIDCPLRNLSKIEGLFGSSDVVFLVAGSYVGLVNLAQAMQNRELINDDLMEEISKLAGFHAQNKADTFDTDLAEFSEVFVADRFDWLKGVK